MTVPERKTLLRAGFAAAGVLILFAGGIFFYFCDPAKCGRLPHCPLHEWTGLYCTGCGGTRALHSLLHGDLAGCFHLNALLLPGMLLAGLLLWKPRLARKPVLWTGIAIVIVLFAVLRNLPAFRFLAPDCLPALETPAAAKYIPSAIKPEIQMEILYNADAIAARVAELGAEITAFYRGKELTVIALMTGGLYFAADLTRAIDLPIRLDSLAVASYTDCKSTGKLNFRSPLKLDPAGRELLVVDEVLDTGVTLKCVRDTLLERGAKTVRTAVMVEKQCPRPENGLLHADWTGFVSPPRYLVGYGLDADENYRNLPHIAALDV